jgi:hypothetical protein
MAVEEREKITSRKYTTKTDQLLEHFVWYFR